MNTRVNGQVENDGHGQVEGGRHAVVLGGSLAA